MKLRFSNGFTLVELMIALVLGILLVGACLAAFRSNSSTYLAGEAIGRMQEGERIAFELMARDIRKAGGNPCDRSIPRYNVLNGPSLRWYSDLSALLKGYAQDEPFPSVVSGGNEGKRILGTAAIELKSAVSGHVQIVEHDPATATMEIGPGGRFKVGQIVMACDFSQAAIFQVTGYLTEPSPSISHHEGGPDPGNCTSRLGWSPAQVCGTSGSAYAFGCYLGQWNVAGGCADVQPTDGKPDKWPASLAPVEATRWYLANNADGQRSLFRESLGSANGAPKLQVDEVLANVSDLEFSYLRSGRARYAPANEMTSADWLANDIIAVRVALTISSPQKVFGGVPGRRLEHVVSVRSNG